MVRTKEGSMHNRHSVAYTKQVESVIMDADIVMEILDARFIDKTRNIDVENKVKEFEKKIIYVLNKADLVDMNELRQAVDLEQMKPYLFFSSKSRKGSRNLKKVIKMEAKKLKKDVVHIGIVGYPNTGKSSIINYLAGKSVARTSPEAGHTKGIQRIRIAAGIYLIDTPGVVPQDEKFTVNRGIVIKNAKIGAVTWNRIKDPGFVVDQIVKDYPNLLEEHYKIQANGDSEVLIEELGRKLHFLEKGNIVDENRTAKKILKDWQDGTIRIKFN